MAPALERFLPPLIGLVLWGLPTLYLARQWWLARRSRDWPSTVGRVLGSEVEYDSHDLQRTHGFHRVTYEYEVDGRTLRGRRVRFGGWLNASPRDAGLTVIRYRPGTPVSVRYDPRRPQLCTLERRMSRLVPWFLAIGLFMTLAIFGALLGWWN
ncbi:MAG TPA: DUF3592 domain-containing protein [Longimicrobiales bacterium]|nr:DUF3592 domain-containing protein [Longimicrobiales bacterium]